ncbi:MAG: ABC transporter substrate-binding protein [Bacteroidetes bacterium]|nr:ABC transporter substrate-binding protein [Bacteroidota bacterium]
MSCAPKINNTTIDELFSNPDLEPTSSIIYAEGFDIYEINGIKKLVIYNPKNISEVLVTYYLTDSLVYNNYLNSDNLILAPLDGVAVFSATQLNAFSKLNLLDKVIAISESEYIQNPEVRDLYDSGNIINLASNGNFYLEKTLELNPSIIFYSPYNMAQSHPLAATEITMIPFFDFMESNPLGRAEWIKFTALFFNKDDEAKQLFDSIETSYNSFKKIALNVIERPTVFSDKYYSGQWFVPGGKSYIARLFNDAGADYLWKENPNSASVNMDFEVVYNKAHNADFWRIVGTYPDGFMYEKLLSENALYEHFDAYNNHKVIFCDSKQTSYFETGTLEPHVLLADLIHAFHPELLPDYNPVYYKLYN